MPAKKPAQRKMPGPKPIKTAEQAADEYRLRVHRDAIDDGCLGFFAAINSYSFETVLRFLRANVEAISDSTRAGLQGDARQEPVAELPPFLAEMVAEAHKELFSPSSELSLSMGEILTHPMAKFLSYPTRDNPFVDPNRGVVRAPTPHEAWGLTMSGPAAGGEPYFVKLGVGASRMLAEMGEVKLYLRFFYGGVVAQRRLMRLRPPTPSELALLAAAAKVEALEPSLPAARKRWETRIGTKTKPGKWRVWLETHPEWIAMWSDAPMALEVRASMRRMLATMARVGKKARLLNFHNDVP